MTTSSSTMEQAALRQELTRIVGSENVLPGDSRQYLQDATEARGLAGRADAVALPGTAEEVAQLLAWCYANEVAITARGGGTGFAGGAVPAGGLVLSLERLRRVRSFEPLVWRICVEAGLPTADLRRLARESGLLFPPDPGAAEQSQVGGNIATNAGGPHAFKYGVTGAYVTGIEVAVAPGELIELGGPVRKDVAGYDLKSLLIGSEGTLGIITAAWLRLVPAPEAAFPVAAIYAEATAGARAIESVMGAGIEAAALEYLDGATLEAAGGSFPVPLPAGAGFVVLAEADGGAAEAERLCDELVQVLEEGALALHAPREPGEVAELWRWRDGVSLAVTAQLGGKVSEDIAVPPERLGEAIEATLEIGARHDLQTCSWGHAGDGNLHSTFMLARGDDDGLRRAEAAAAELFGMALRLGGSISGEHGVGHVKRGFLADQYPPPALGLMTEVKAAFDPKSLLNPGKKLGEGP